jgi:hypothetical protein
MVCERPPRSLCSRLPLTRGRLTPPIVDALSPFGITHIDNVRALFSPSVRGRAAEGGRGSLTHHLEFELGNTPEGRGLEFRTPEPRSGERIFFRSAAHLASDPSTTAFSRGYSLSPLCGWDVSSRKRRRDAAFRRLFKCIAEFNETRLAASHARETDPEGSRFRTEAFRERACIRHQ